MFYCNLIECNLHDNQRTKPLTQDQVSKLFRQAYSLLQSVMNLSGIKNASHILNLKLIIEATLNIICLTIKQQQSLFLEFKSEQNNAKDLIISGLFDSDSRTRQAFFNCINQFSKVDVKNRVSYFIDILIKNFYRVSQQQNSHQYFVLFQIFLQVKHLSEPSDLLNQILTKII